MKFTLQEIRYANSICFPEDFDRLYQKYAGWRPSAVQSKTVLDFLCEYGSDPRQLDILGLMVEDLLKKRA